MSASDLAITLIIIALVAPALVGAVAVLLSKAFDLLDRLEP